MIERAEIAERLYDIVVILAETDNKHDLVDSIRDTCIDAHKLLLGEEDFISLVVWIESITRVKCWQQITANQWKSIAEALSSACEHEPYDYSRFVSSKNILKSSGLSLYEK